MTSADITPSVGSGNKLFFYTDPLAAAWMQKKFGVMLYRFTTQDMVIEYGCGEVGERFDWQDSSILKDIDTLEELLGELHETDWAPVLVHEDSVHLLTPKVGDILRLYFYLPAEDDKHGAAMTGFYAGGREAITRFRNPEDGSIDKQAHAIDDHQWRIIQRDGMPFHYPESEEVEKAARPTMHSH